MSPSFWADVILVTHFLIVLGILIPIPLIFLGKIFNWSWVRNLWFRLIHIGIMAVVVVQDLIGRICPLTDWESGLRILSGEAAYPNSFVGYWVDRILFLNWPPYGFTVLYLSLGFIILLLLLWVPPRRRIT